MIKAAEDHVMQEVRPRANAIDQNLDELRAALDGLAAKGYLGLRVPSNFGGHGVPDVGFRRFQEALARCSGALAFLQTQHQSACAFVATSANTEAHKAFLPGFASGKMRCGIAFSQLRRPGRPMMTAQPTKGGYLFSGTAPWITGWDIFDHCVFAGTIESGESVWGVGELRESRSLRPSPVMRLAALEVCQTVSAELIDYFVPSEAIIHTRPADWITNNDSLNLALQSPFALGCAGAGIDVLRNVFEKKPLDDVLTTSALLDSELASCRENAYAAMDDKGNFEKSLQARAWAIELAGRCAHAAVVASSGRGNSMESDAQRVYREALVFSVSAQTPAILGATLRRFTREKITVARK